jgi:hypothetical protein
MCYRINVHIKGEVAYHLTARAISIYIAESLR